MVEVDFLVSALRGQPRWGYVHGGRVNHRLDLAGGRRAACGVEPKPGARWRGTHVYAFGMAYGLSHWIARRRRYCSRCASIPLDRTY